MYSLVVHIAACLTGLSCLDVQPESLGKTYEAAPCYRCARAWLSATHTDVCHKHRITSRLRCDTKGTIELSVVTVMAVFHTMEN